MYMSGAQTGMAVTDVVRRLILKALTVGRTACAVAVAGATTPGAVARRFVTTSSRRSASTTLACGWPFEFAIKLPLLG